MPILRRDLLRRLGASVIGGAAVRSIGGLPLAAIARPRWDVDQPRKPVFLDHNENAYGPSDRVLAALRDAVIRGNRYPREECEALVDRLAAAHNVKPDQILLGCGSSEILKQAATTFLGPHKKLVQAAPTCPVLGSFAQANGVEIVDVPLNRRHQHDLESMLARAGNSAGLIYICNPNNPTATSTPRADLDGFLKKVPSGTAVVIDEAYHHFVAPSSSDASFLERPSENPRVVVCRTFSKVYGLAGLRIGYAVGAPEIIGRLSLGHLRYGVGTLAAIAAAAAFDDVAYVQQAVQRNSNDRQEFLNRINTVMLRALDCQANFVFFNPMRPVDMVIDHLRNHQVVVGPPFPAMKEYLRVSLGAPDEMREFWRVMDLLPPTGKMAM